MRLLDQLASRFSAPRLTRGRMALALMVAVAADALQIALLPVAWTFAQEFIDVVAMILTVLILGFHPLLLPTFVLEFIPLVDMLPTWTGCVAVVIALRKRSQPPIAPPSIVDVPPVEELPPRISDVPPGQGTTVDCIVKARANAHDKSVADGSSPAGQ